MVGSLNRCWRAKDLPGLIVLYSGNQIVVFYGSNSWAYTRLGHIDMTQEELTELLGNGDAEINYRVGETYIQV